MKTFILALALAAFSGIPGFDSAVLIISGASSMEELDESTLERFRDLSLRPIELNGSSRSRLLASGLFNPFQVASLIDWRQRSGDILSYTELGLLDGFTPEYAEALKYFTRLESSGPPGVKRGVKMHNDLMLRASVKENDGLSSAAGLRYKASFGDRAELNWASRTTYSDNKPGTGTISAAYYGRKTLGKIVLGHFGARFGQGLAQWSGFSLQPYGSVASLRRSGTGFAATGSFSPELCGAAADFELGRWNLGAAYDFSGKKPIAFLSYTGRSVSAGATVAGKAFGAHWQIAVPSASFYGELAWNGGFRGVAGVMWVPVYGRKLGAVARYIDGIPELIAGTSLPGLDAVAAFSTRQLRAMVKYAPELHAGPLDVTPALRLAARRTEAWRLEGRGETQLDLSGWMLRSRIDFVYGTGLAWLVNAEAGRTEGKLKAYLRWTLFKVENWNDRIYVYERDAPGTFNVPAYYGKGWALALAGSWKPSRKHSFYWRISYMGYPWMTEYKASRAEVKLQYSLSL